MFADKYGPWALVAGASDGVGAALADGLAQRGVNVVLLARRQPLLDEVAAGIENRHGVQTRTLAIDLATETAASQIAEATGDLEIGFLAYCAGADPNYQPFLDSPLAAAEAMVQRNCVVPMRLCHHFAAPMVSRARGGIVLFGSGAGFAGAPNMVAYGASKAFDMVFAEALWAELHDKGVDVIGLILGKTDTPSLRTLEHKRPAIDGRPRRCGHRRGGGDRGIRQPGQRAHRAGRRRDEGGRPDTGNADPQAGRGTADGGRRRHDGVNAR
ncbi:hypothetical protein MYFR107205_07410 [Mycolicibacterium frederiksbergense]